MTFDLFKVYFQPPTTLLYSACFVLCEVDCSEKSPRLSVTGNKLDVIANTHSLIREIK